MIASKRDKLETINTFAVYDSSKTVFTSNAEYQFVFFKVFYFIIQTDICYTSTTNAKAMIEHYNLRQSVLRFQIMLTDANNILYPTNCCCETVTLTEYRGKLYLVQLTH